ncbi:MAG: sterol desaturase family protein [Bacteriovoracaceae bacterium]
MDSKFSSFIIILLILSFLQWKFPWRRSSRYGLDFLKGLFLHLGLIGLGNFLVWMSFSVILPFLNWQKILAGKTLMGSFLQWLPGSFLIGLLILDLLLYFQHRLMHQVDALWKIHRLHHTDRKMDVTTGLRFHPLEILFSTIYKIFVCFLFGIPYEVYLTFEVYLLFGSLFSHSNIRITGSIERILSLLFVTPRMHYIHHFTDSHFQNKNFGFLLNIWDRIFGSFVKKSDHQIRHQDLGVRGRMVTGFFSGLKDPFS